MENDEREEYLTQRKVYSDEETRQTDNLDKYLLAISSGSFGLSFMFIEKILKESMKNPYVLFYSWIMFALSIISSLLSFACSKHAHSKAIEEYDKMYNNSNYEFKTPIIDNFTKIFNWYSFGFLIIGFIAFIVFAYINVIGEN